MWPHSLQSTLNYLHHCLQSLEGLDLQLLLSGTAAAIRMIRVHLLSDTYLRVVGQEGLPQKNPRLSLKAADLLIVWPIATWTELNNVL